MLYCRNKHFVRHFPFRHYQLCMNDVWQGNTQLCSLGGWRNRSKIERFLTWAPDGRDVIGFAEVKKPEDR